MGKKKQLKKVQKVSKAQAKAQPRKKKTLKKVGAVARAGIESVPFGSVVTTAYDQFKPQQPQAPPQAKGTGKGKRKSAKLILKKAYEKRALRKIRIGNLGGARKDLYKKATVM